MVTETEIINALKVVAKDYGKPLAITIERLFRNETAHFKSGGFKQSLSPGMEAVKNTMPYGWSTLEPYWTKEKSYAPIALINQVENNSAMSKSLGVKTFIKFPTIEASMMSVAYLIHARGGDGGRWFSNQESEQGKALREKYNLILTQIIPRYCNTFN